MKKKIFSLLLSLAMVVAMMPMQYINVEAKTKLKTKVTVSTQAGLKKALKNKKLKSLTIKTTKKKNFSIPKGSYKKVYLYVNAPNSDVKNSGSFKKINIKNIASNTWAELAKNNILKFETSKGHVVVSDKAVIREIKMTKANSNMTVDVSGNVNRITVGAKVTLDINGTSKNLINVNVLNGANGTVINSNVKLDVKTSANTAINLYKGAEDSVVKTNNEYIIVDLTNNTDSSVKIINHAGTLNTVNSGIKAVIGGNGNKISSSDEKENQEPSNGGGGSGSGITKEDLEKAKEEARRQALEEASAAAASAEAAKNAAEAKLASAEAARKAAEAKLASAEATKNAAEEAKNAAEASAEAARMEALSAEASAEAARKAALSAEALADTASAEAAAARQAADQASAEAAEAKLKAEALSAEAAQARQTAEALSAEAATASANAKAARDALAVASAEAAEARKAAASAEAALSAEAKRHAAEFSAYKEEANKTVSSEAVKTMASLSDSALHVNRKGEIKLLISGIVSSTGAKIASADGLLAIDKAKTLAVEKLKAMSRMFEELAETPPSEGDIINLKDVTGDGFRIIKYYCTNDEPFANAELLAMNGKNMKWNSTSDHLTDFKLTDGSTYHSGSTYQQYEGSDVDTYLNTTYYGSLPQNIKTAIVPQTNLKQGLYENTIIFIGIEGIDYWKGTYYDSNNDKTYYVNNTKATASMDAKYVYALDVQDVMDYLGTGNLTYLKLRTMFFGSEAEVSRCCWLRSASLFQNDYAMCVGGGVGNLFNNYVDYDASEVRAAFTINLDRVNYSLKEASDAEQHIIIDAVDTISSADSETVINEAIQAGKQALVNQAKADEVTTYNYPQKSAIETEYNETITTVREAGLSENATMSAEATINEIKEKAMTDIDSASKKIDVKDIKNLTINKLQSISRIIEEFKTFGNPAEKTPFMIKKIAKIKEVTTQDEVNGLVDDALEFMKIKKGDLVTLKGLSADGTEGDDQFRVIKINGNQVELLAMNGREIKYNVSSNAVSVIFDNEEKTVQKYAGSDLDNYLNSSADGNYYASLPQNIKDAIIPQNIEQYAYIRNPVEPLEKTCWIVSGDSNLIHIYYDENAKINVGTRNIYALDVRDIIEFIGEENLTSQNIINMWSSPKTQGKKSHWLRSASVDNDILILGIDYSSFMNMTFNAISVDARAAFVIDLSEVKFKVD